MPSPITTIPYWNIRGAYILLSATPPAAVRRAAQRGKLRGAQLFVFVPGIQLVEPMVRLLRQEISILPGDRSGTDGVSPIEGTSSKYPLRTEKVQLFRDRAIRVLVTTTILERGVTVPKSDVFIFDSDSSLLDEAALVQMSGRAGRSKEDPAGKDYFAAKEKTK